MSNNIVHCNIINSVIATKCYGIKYIYKDDILVKTSDDIIIDVSDLENGYYIIKCNDEITKIHIVNG